MKKVIFLIKEKGKWPIKNMEAIIIDISKKKKKKIKTEIAV